MEKMKSNKTGDGRCCEVRRIVNFLHLFSKTKFLNFSYHSFALHGSRGSKHTFN